MSENNTDNCTENKNDNNSSNLFFSQKALSNLQSPEDLEKSLSASMPGSWILIIACLALLIGFFVWSIFGLSMKRATLQGMATLDGYVIAFADADTAINIEKGDPVYINGEESKVDSVELTPVDAFTLTEEYEIEPLYAEILVKDKLTYPVLIKKDFDYSEVEKKDDVILDVSVIMDQKSPIQLLFEI